VVCVNGNSWSLGREGVVTAADLQRLTACRVVFVCTGNTCRSPLAEALCKRRLAERLGCSPEELPQRGFDVQSAGVAALAGGPAADEAVEAARAFGADLSGHQSQPLTARLVALSDFVVSMTHSHLRTVAEQVPNPAARLRLLSPEGQDLADPIGGDQEVYRECAQQIWQHLEGLVAELIPP
jgi:protein-tyrosine phosphatase